MINYDKQFNARINKVIRNFNAKVRRLEAQGIKHLPDTVSVAEIKATYFERDSLKRKLKQLERFNTRGAEEIVELQGGAKATKWEIETLKSDIKYLKNYYSKKIDTYGNIIPTSLGVKQSVSYARMGDAKYENLKVLRGSLDKDITSMEQTTYNRFRRKIGAQMRRKNKQDYIFWSNYLTFLEDVGYKADIDPELIDRVKHKILEMDIKDFMELYEKEEAILDIVDYYNIQKIKAGGFSRKKNKQGYSEVDTINELYKTLDLMIDDDFNINRDIVQ